MKRTLFLLALAGLCGCATTANYRRAVDSWIGVDAETLVKSWGYPERTFAAPDGNTVYEYDSSETYKTSRFTTYTYDPRSGTGYSTAYGGDTLNFYCYTYFEIGKDNRVAGVSFKGNSCKASAPKKDGGRGQP